MALNTITDYINGNAAAIIDNLEHESIKVYSYLTEKFNNTDATKDLPFQFMYRSFYRLDNAGLTPAFKTAYFEILQTERATSQPDLKAILERLRHYHNRKGQENVQFSFLTKLANTINNNYPIYDSEVARVFGYSRPTDRDFNIKVGKYLKQFDHIKHSYEQIVSAGLLSQTIVLFDIKFNDHDLSPMKRLDFIFWSAGKLQKKADLAAKKASKAKVTAPLPTRI